MPEDDDSEAAIHSVATVPPPAGEGDAYNAPTRVGTMAAAAFEELMVAAERDALQRSPRPHAEKRVPSAVSPAMVTTVQPEDSVPLDVPRMRYDEDAVDEDVGTLRSRGAKAPAADPPLAGDRVEAALAAPTFARASTDRPKLELRSPSAEAPSSFWPVFAVVLAVAAAVFYFTTCS